MALQIRITDGDGSNSIILEGADGKSYSKALNSASEGISFEIPKNNSKAEYVNPYNSSTYTRLWEVWDTRLNKRLNFGPITSVDDSPETYKVEGAGRSAFLNDYFQTVKTYYARIDSILEETRFENVAVSPSASTLVDNMDEDDADNTKVFNLDVFTYPRRPKYYNLSKRSKDFAIDDESHYIPIGKIEPPRTFSTTNEYWTGISQWDTLLVDLGASYDITKIRLLFPWWGGPQRATNRTYDFLIDGYPDAAEGGYLWATVEGRKLGSPINLFSSWTVFGDVSRIVTTPDRPYEIYFGSKVDQTGTKLNSFYMLTNQPDPVRIRYIAIWINGVHAWYGTDNDAKASYDGIGYQCDWNYRPGDNPDFGNKLGLMTYRKKDGTIKEKRYPDEVIKPSNDCHASIVEIGAFKEIIPKKTIKPLAIQRIDNNNMQITYSRVPDSTEMKKHTVDGKVYRKFEPGTFFRKFTATWSSADNTYTKFYKDDCDDCYPSGFSLGVVDDDNSLIYRSDSSSSAGVTIKGKQYTKHILSRGASNFLVTSVDCWKGKTDPMSWGGTYSYTEKTGDYFTLHFRGESLKWYATIPSDKTGATVKIELRYKIEGSRKGSANVTTDYWTSWTTLENSYKLPEGVSSYVVYEIPYNSGVLTSETVYELKVTLLDNNYCSVDSFEGYWSASFTEYNEDSNRIVLSQPDVFKQIYNKKFTAGSMYKWNKPGATASFQFEGDRIIIQSAKGRHHGKLTLILLTYEEGINRYDPGTANHVFIPTSKGGDPTDGSLTVDLDTGNRGQEFPNYVIFDSNDIFNTPGEEGLPWGKYMMKVIHTPADKYTASKADNGSSSFQYRCRDCDPDTSGKTASIYEYVYLDAMGVHERIGVSVNFDQKSHLEIIQSTAEALQVEWDASEDGLIFEPRIGRDTDIALREGENTLISYQIANDITKVATRLLSYGASIDGLDMFAITEDKKTKEDFGRTITRQQDFRDVASYMQLIGLSRMELKRRQKPERRINVTHIAEHLELERGDSFILWTKKSGNIRVRINNIQWNESSSSGTSFTLECVEWPQIS